MVLTSHDKLKLCNKSLEVYQILVQHIDRDNSGLSLARMKDSTCFLRWIMSVMTNSTVQAGHQKVMGSKTMEMSVSTIILNVYQSTGIEKEDDSRQSLENHGKHDEIRRFYNKKFEEGHDVHRNLASVEDYSRPNKQKKLELPIYIWCNLASAEDYSRPNKQKKLEYQYISGVMGIAYNPFLDSEAGSAHRNHEVTELLKF